MREILRHGRRLMNVRSTPQRYGAVAIGIHWLTAVLIVGQFAGGVGASLADPQGKIAILRFHAPLGVAIGVLTVLRIVWWVVFDRKPQDVVGSSRAQIVAAKAVHGLLYLTILALAVSGMTLMVLSGAGQVIFGDGARSLPDFTTFGPFYGHAAMAILLLVLFAAHVAAALYHQFVRRDAILSRMWI